MCVKRIVDLHKSLVPACIQATIYMASSLLFRFLACFIWKTTVVLELIMTGSCLVISQVARKYLFCTRIQCYVQQKRPSEQLIFISTQRVFAKQNIT